MRTVHTHRCTIMLNTSKRRNGKKERKHQHTNHTYTKHIQCIRHYTQHTHAHTHSHSVYTGSIQMWHIYYIVKAFYVEWKMVQFLLVREKKRKKCSRRSSFIRLFARYQFVSDCLGIVVASVDAFSNVKCSYSRCARKIEIIFLRISLFFSHHFVECRCMCTLYMQRKRYMFYIVYVKR